MKIEYKPFYGTLILEPENEAEYHQLEFVTAQIRGSGDMFCNRFPKGLALALAEDTLQATKKNLIPNKTGGGE